MENVLNKTINLNTATSPLTIQVGSDTDVITFYNAKSLAATFAIQASGTPSDNCTVMMLFTGVITSNGNTFSIFGVNLDSDTIKYPFFALCYYTNAAWTVSYGRLRAATIETSGGLGEGTGGGIKIAAGGVTNAMIAAGAGIDYSKLNLTGAVLNADLAGSIAYGKIILFGSVVNADIASGAGIVYSKLALTGGVVNADINASAAIGLSKLAALTASRILASDGSGVIAPVDTATYPTLAELACVKGLTSSAQTQIATKAATSYVDSQDAALSAAIAAVNTTIETYSTINANTTLTSSTIKQNIRIDATAGAVDITLPSASTIANGFATNWIVMGANIVRLLAHGSENVRNLTNNDVSSITITGAGNRAKTICDGTNTFYQT